jgi:predicted nucleic acid-binding protein
MCLCTTPSHRAGTEKAGTVPFVVDNSVVSGWYLANQASPYGDAVLSCLTRDRAVAPALWELELVNVLRMACLRQRMTAQHAQAVLGRLGALPIEVDRHPVPRSELLALSLRFGLSAYDAAYLELALRQQCPVATLDTALADAAVASGVGLLQPGTTRDPGN